MFIAYMISDLETIVAAVMLACGGALVFGVAPMAYFMNIYAGSHNSKKRREFLGNELGEDNLANIRTGTPRSDPERKGILLVPVEFDGEKYLMELEHRKSSWFADLFYDTRLYEPVGLVPQ